MGSNSICIGTNSGLGFGASAIPANSLTIAPIRLSPAPVSNGLFYNTTTKEITYDAASSSGGALNSLTIVPSSTDLNNPALGFVNNYYGQVSSACTTSYMDVQSVPVGTGQEGLDSRKNLMRIHWGSNAPVPIGNYSDEMIQIQVRYNLACTSGSGNALGVDSGIILLNPSNIKSNPAWNVNHANWSGSGAAGIIWQGAPTQELLIGTTFYTTPNDINQLWVQYTLGDDFVEMWTYSKTSTYMGVLGSILQTDTVCSLTCEILNNGGIATTDDPAFPMAAYTTRLEPLNNTVQPYTP